MSARYSTNKKLLPEALISEMKESFKRCQELLDLEEYNEDPTLKQKQDIQDSIAKATPQELGQMLEMIHQMNIGKMAQAKE